jgi:hypothetical protein
MILLGAEGDFRRVSVILEFSWRHALSASGVANSVQPSLHSTGYPLVGFALASQQHNASSDCKERQQRATCHQVLLQVRPQVYGWAKFI